MDGHVADKLIVAAKTNDGVELFLVDAKTAGITTERIISMDSRNYANIQFDNVFIPESAKLAEYESGAALLEKTLDIGRIGLAAEMLGGIQEAFDRHSCLPKGKRTIWCENRLFSSLTTSSGPNVLRN